MVVDVAEESLELVGDAGLPAVLKALERREERPHGAVELDHLALQEVDALGRIGALAEDLLLDLLDVVVDPGDDGRVVVDDLVDDCPDDGARAGVHQTHRGRPAACGRGQALSLLHGGQPPT